jgi:hypothetical protein
MKKIKMLITLSLTLCVLAVGSISVFATDATFPVLSSGEYRFNDMITSPVEFTEYWTTGLRILISDEVDLSQLVGFDTVVGSKTRLYMTVYSDQDTFSLSYLAIDEQGKSISAVVYENGRWNDDSYRFIYTDGGFFRATLNNVDIPVDANQYYFDWFISQFSVSSNFVEDIFELFQSIIVWLVGFFGVFVGLFWTSTSGLTVLGVLSVIALGISIFFLIFAVIINFFRFRGR